MIVPHLEVVVELSPTTSRSPCSNEVNSAEVENPTTINEEEINAAKALFSDASCCLHKECENQNQTANESVIELSPSPLLSPLVRGSLEAESDVTHSRSKKRRTVSPKITARLEGDDASLEHGNIPDELPVHGGSLKYRPSVTPKHDTDSSKGFSTPHKRLKRECSSPSSTSDENQQEAVPHQQLSDDASPPLGFRRLKCHSTICSLDNLSRRCEREKQLKQLALQLATRKGMTVPEESDADVGSSPSARGSFINDDDSDGEYLGSPRSVSSSEIEFRKNFIAVEPVCRTLAPVMDIEVALRWYLEYYALILLSPTFQLPLPKMRGTPTTDAYDDKLALYESATRTVEGRLRTKKSQFEGMWAPDFVKTLMRYPKLAMTTNEILHQDNSRPHRCAACNRRDASCRISAVGLPYESEHLWERCIKDWHIAMKLQWAGKAAFPKYKNPLQISESGGHAESTSSEGQEFSLSITIGQHCLKRAFAWHFCQHWKHHTLLSLWDWIFEQPHSIRRSPRQLIEKLSRDENFQNHHESHLVALCAMAPIEIRASKDKSLNE